MFAYIVRRVDRRHPAPGRDERGHLPAVLRALRSTPERFACGKNCSPQLTSRPSKALGYDEPTIVQWGKFAKGFVNGREYPDDPALRAAAPEQVVDCPAPLPRLLHRLQHAGQRPDQGRAAGLGLAGHRGVLSSGSSAGSSSGSWPPCSRARLLDRGIVGLALVVFAFPTFFIGLLPAQVRRHQVGAGAHAGTYTPSPREASGCGRRACSCPALTLALFYMAGYVRMTRAFVLESMTEDYIRTARAKGLRRGGCWSSTPCAPR